MSVRVTEGYSSLSLPDIAPDCKTYYKKIAAEPSSKSETALPLVVVHGGPLLAHDYCLTLQPLAQDSKISFVLYYDQIGCGQSTHITEGKEAFSHNFWSNNIYQLKSLVDDLGLTSTGFVLFGHSLGTTLAAAYAAAHPDGVKALFLANATTSFSSVKRSNLQLLNEFSPEVARNIIQFEKFCLGERTEADVSLDDYLSASDVFRREHFNRAPQPTTQYFDKSMEKVMEVIDVFASICGGTVRFLWGGPAADFSTDAELHKITASTLVIKGEFDQAQASCQEPLLKLIPQVKEVTLSGTSHMTTEEAPEDLMNAILTFLADF